MIETLYSKLGVDKSATEAEIKLAFYKLASEHHPDRGGDSAVMAEINVAYNTLTTPSARRKYDEQLALMAEVCPKCEGSGRRWKQKGLTARTATACTDCNGNGFLKWLRRKEPTATVINLGGAAARGRKRK